MSSLEERQRENVEVVRRIVDAYQRGDFDAIFALAHPDFEVFLPQNLPNSGRYVGQDGFMTWLGQWLEAREGFTVEIGEAQSVGERHVIADMHQFARGKGSGIAVEMEIAYLWDVWEGRLVGDAPLCERDEAVRIAEERESPSPD
jgi:ketosteroid isomerase-like protein